MPSFSPSAAGPHRPPSFADIPTARYLRFSVPRSHFLGAGFFFSPQRRMLPGRISTPWSHLDSTQTWRAHARRHLCPMCPPHRGPDPRPRPDGSRNARLRRLVPPRDRPRDRPQRHPRTNLFSIWPGQGIVVQQWLHDVWLWAWYARAAAMPQWPCPPACPPGSSSGSLPASCSTPPAESSRARGWRLASPSPLYASACTYRCARRSGPRCCARSRPGLCSVTSGTAGAWCCCGSRRRRRRRQPPGGPLAASRRVRRGVRPCRTRMSSADPAARRAWSARALPICAALAAMCAASLLNPYGADGSLYVLKSLGEAAYGGAIVEMQPYGSSSAPFRRSRRDDGAGTDRAVPAKRSESPGRRRGNASRRYRRGVLHSRCMWIAGLFCGLCCAFDSQGRSGSPWRTRGARPPRQAPPWPPDRRGLGARGIAGAAIGRRGGHAIRDRIGDVPIFSAIYDAGSDALVFSSDVSVYNQLEWEGFKVPCDMRPRDLGRGHRRRRGGSPPTARSSTSSRGRPRWKRVPRTGAGSCSSSGDDEADALRSGGHFDELAHGGGYTLFELPEGGGE